MKKLMRSFSLLLLTLLSLAIPVGCTKAVEVEDEQETTLQIETELLEFTTKADDETYLYPMYTSPTTGIDATDSDEVTDRLISCGWKSTEDENVYLYFYRDGTGVWQGSEFGEFDYTVRNGRLVIINYGGDKKTFRFKFNATQAADLMLQEKPIGETYYFTES